MKRLQIILLLFLTCSAQVVFPAVIRGNPKGTVTLIEFFDYECPHCQHMSKTIEALIVNNTQLKVVYCVTPIYGTPSWYAASAVLASKFQNKYDLFRSLLLQQNTFLNPPAVLDLAKKSGLNINQLASDMQKPKVLDQIKKNLALEHALTITEVPTFLINRTDKKSSGIYFIGEVSYTDLQRAINQFN